MHLVQATLGHAAVATTGRYLHARPTDSSVKYFGGQADGRSVEAARAVLGDRTQIADAHLAELDAATNA